MKKILALGVILCSVMTVNAQKEDVKPDDTNKVFTIVQQQPRFPGDINKWLRENIVYPEAAKKNNKQGTVYVSFIVEKNGSVSGAKVVRGADKDLDAEGLRVVNAMPKWTPGIQNGHTVRVQYMLPIKFTL